MIDVHIHVTPPRLPGVGPLMPILQQSPEQIATALRREMRYAGIQQACAIGCWNGGDNDPLGLATTLAVAAQTPGLRLIGVADPTRTDPLHLQRVEQLLASGTVVALKLYLGYLHYEPAHPNYRPYYELAARYKLPVFLHTGDTFSPKAKLKYAHPLGVDEVAVDHPDVHFVLCHVGNPWMLDAAEVIYKNLNVWADLSGLLIGDEQDFANPDMEEHIAELADRLVKAIRYSERPNRFLYGSDWPLAPMLPYRNALLRILPTHWHELIFVENARRLLRLP
ncbi:MAG: amidohydrolase [Gemmataceae bacterium]|nr:amidohydrolase [Gemmataceae bacterium]MCS7269545.1 amidohydrolase [Gemmataceae bacterium]MDW8242423.1 amidohydrolase family protein [Thermogemmata sp.]